MFRILRVFKIVKMMRLVRVLNTFRELRVISLSMVASIRSTFWALLLICMVTYLFSLVFMQGVAEYLRGGREMEVDSDAPKRSKRGWGNEI